MSDTATILIPDISGFTDFMSTTELEHSSHIISIFLEAIVQSVDESFEVSEIEGDAVLLYKKGDPLSKKELLDQCLKIFNAFHYQRKIIQQLTVCPCGVCQGMINLTLKFIAHFGTISEIKVNRFTKASGLDMIIAHRLLKNGISSNEYVLLTKNLLSQINDDAESFGMVWQVSSEEFPAIGKVEFNYALLEMAKKNVPDPPMPDTHYAEDNTSYFDIKIEANFKEVYGAVLDIRNRIHWMEGILKIEQGENSGPYLGSVQYYVFDGYKTLISPISLKMSDEEIIYAESSKTEEMNLSTVYEFRFRPIENDSCQLTCRILAAEGTEIPGQIRFAINENLRLSCENLKAYCENDFKPVRAGKEPSTF